MHKNSTGHPEFKILKNKNLIICILKNQEKSVRKSREIFKKILKIVFLLDRLCIFADVVNYLLTCSEKL